ncbi:MAG TPA: exodeoxyribonuclease III [Stellaceae bacterium]|nr:exodeoxyribonuclease III [Stellaceae bacterium]
MALTLATWNINSVRLRINLVRRFLRKYAPDVLCLQETKSPDEHFPREAFEELGYTHMLVHGMKGYNGVATVSRLPLAGPHTRSWCAREDCRHAVTELPGGIELHNLYIPAGGDIPDPKADPKFAHKLQFLDEVTAWFTSDSPRDKKAILVGDLNIAPLETDVWSHKDLLKVVSHTPIEVEKLAKLQGAGGFVDAVRHVITPEQKLYTWWSYRAQDWKASDRGRRLDHIWVTPALVPEIAGAEVFKPARGWAQGSDHVPVILRFKDVSV